MSVDAPLLEIAARYCAEGSALGIMVSGGGDSMALLDLLHRAAVGQRLEVLTVDHGLRAAARAEAEMVAAYCAVRGIAHQVSRWAGGEAAGNLMDAARQARYLIAVEWAQVRGLSRVAVGHTADDQAETFLMGLARQAGIDGLSGMRRHWMQDSVRFDRPLLGVTRADLRSYLRRNGVVWADDPTNDDTHYTRVRARKALAQLGSLGITAQGLAAVSDHLETARQALLGQLGTAAQGVRETAAGSLMIPRAGFDPLPAEIKRRLLITALRWISGATYPPREAALANLVQVMGQGGDTTLGGVRFRSTATSITVQREARAQRGQICATDQTWDNRWQLSGPHAPDLTIRALGADGLRQVKDWRDTGLPREALLATPAIWRDETLIAAPCAGFSNDWCAICSPSFASFVLSH